MSNSLIISVSNPHTSDTPPCSSSSPSLSLCHHRKLATDSTASSLIWRASCNLTNATAGMNCPTPMAAVTCIHLIGLSCLGCLHPSPWFGESGHLTCQSFLAAHHPPPPTHRLVSLFRRGFPRTSWTASPNSPTKILRASRLTIIRILIFGKLFWP